MKRDPKKQTYKTTIAKRRKEKTPLDRDVNRQQHRCANESYGTAHR